MSVPAANASFILGVFTARLGDPYVYGGVWSPTDASQGCDCSGCVGTVLEALTNGAAGMNWNHDVSTESWPFDYGTNTPAAPGTVGPYGTIAIASAADAPADAALIVNIMHGGGGEDSHMSCFLPATGTYMESNGDHGTCTGTDAYPNTASLWSDHWYLPGPMNGVVTPVTAPAQRRGVDYAGGRPSGAAIKAAGYDFACRYLSNGGVDLPGKQLLASEVADLQANGVDIVSNWETTGTDALDGFGQGVTDAQEADAYHRSVGGPATAPIFFSLDWDEAPAQDSVVDDYFHGVASVIGLERTGAYGAYWILTRLQAAGLITWTWQTQAWSGDNQDTVLNILQDNDAGYASIDGVQCDINIALTEDFGQWNGTNNEGWNDMSSPTPQDVIDMFSGTNADGSPFVGPDGADYRRVDLLAPDTESLDEGPNTTRSIVDQITTLSKILTKTHNGKTLFQMIADLHDKTAT